MMCKMKYLCEFLFLDVTQIFLQLSYSYLLPRIRQGLQPPENFLVPLIFHDIYAGPAVKTTCFCGPSRCVACTSPPIFLTKLYITNLVLDLDYNGRASLADTLFTVTMM